MAIGAIWKPWLLLVYNSPFSFKYLRIKNHVVLTNVKAYGCGWLCKGLKCDLKRILQCFNFSPLFQVSLNKFVRLAGDLLPAPLFVPYMEMLSGLANSPQAAHHCFNLLKSTANGPLSWDHFFASIKQYYMDLRQDGAHSGEKKEK